MSMKQILSVPVGERDLSWELKFLRNLGEGSIAVTNPDPVQGPDGWPYLMASTEGAAAASAGDFEPTAKVVRWLSDRGMGLVINAEKPLPDFVLSYGMIWNFRERGEFLTAVSEKNENRTPQRGALTIVDGQKLFAGPPSRTYLPDDVRGVLREFLKRQRVLAPKVLMLSADESNWDLAFSIESLGSPPQAEHSQIAEAIAWFLPQHYSVALVSEKTVPGFDLL